MLQANGWWWRWCRDNFKSFRSVYNFRVGKWGCKISGRFTAWNHQLSTFNLSTRKGCTKPSKGQKFFQKGCAEKTWVILILLVASFWKRPNLTFFLFSFLGWWIRWYPFYLHSSVQFLHAPWLQKIKQGSNKNKTLNLYFGVSNFENLRPSPDVGWSEPQTPKVLMWPLITSWVPGRNGQSIRMPWLVMMLSESWHTLFSIYGRHFMSVMNHGWFT